MSRINFPSILLLCIIAAGACAPAAPSVPRDGGVQPAPTQPSRTLILALRTEPTYLGGVALEPIGIGTGTLKRLFNAGLALLDGESRPQPYLAEALPQLNTDSWRVFPDGRMETTYRLKPNLTWHDGTPVSSEDFVFAHRVYATPEFGIANVAPQSFMQEIVAPDARTVVIRWRRPFPDAGALRGSGGLGPEETAFAPVPRHVLERVYQEQRDGFIGHPAWTTDFVGLGPYRVDRWERGAFLEALAFDGHALGRPKIDRVKLVWNADFNTTLANLLAGEAHMPVDFALRVQQGLVLKREWGTRNAGTVEYRPSLWRWVQIQHRPEYANPRAVLDLRVRKALTHAIDKQAINDSLFEGAGIPSDTIVPPTEDYFALVDRALAKYALDLRRSEELMNEAGYTKGADGFYASPSEGRLNFEVKVVASPQNDAERTIMADGWRRAGFSMDEGGFSPSEVRDGQTVGTFRSLSTTSGALGAYSLAVFTTAAIPRPENRWNGQNRGGWSSPEFDRFVDGYQSTLDRTERNQQIVQATKVLSEQLGVLPLYFNPDVLAYPTGLHGVNIKSADGEVSWNIHQWEFR